MGSANGPAEQRALVNRLVSMRSAELESFFESVDLGSEYRKPAKFAAKLDRINSALAAAQARGVKDDILSAIAAYLGESQIAPPADRASWHTPSVVVDPQDRISSSVASAASAEERKRQVFVIHGRNDKARKELFTFLRSIGLSPMEWSYAMELTGKASPYIGDVLNAAFSNAQAIVVLQTPDDVAYLHPSLTHHGDPETEPQLQARANVIFEAGMAIGRDPDRTVIIEFGKVKPFSDLSGRHVVRLSNEIGRRQDLANRLRTAGCLVNTNGADWHDAGDLTPPEPPGGGLPLGRRLPAVKVAGKPRLDADYLPRGANTLADLRVTNHGPGDAFELNVTVRDYVDEARMSPSLPVAKLPAGKSITVGQMPPAAWMGVNDEQISHLYLDARFKTADGVAVNQELFVSIG